MLGNVKGSKGKSFFPVGYELMSGNLISGTSITVPVDIIPITIKLSGGNIWGASSNSGGSNGTNTNLGNIYSQGAPGRSRVYLPTVFYDLYALYGFSYETLKNINTISSYANGTAGESGVPATITIVQWLQKK